MNPCNCTNGAYTEHMGPLHTSHYCPHCPTGAQRRVKDNLKGNPLCNCRLCHMSQQEKNRHTIGHDRLISGLDESIQACNTLYKAIRKYSSKTTKTTGNDTCPYCGQSTNFPKDHACSSPEVKQAFNQLTETVASYRQETLQAINILDGNEDPIDWRDPSQPELLRKLCEHLEYHKTLEDQKEDLTEPNR